MQSSRAPIIVFCILLSVFLAFYGRVNHAQSTTNGQLEVLRSEWVGQYPHKGKRFFLNEPKIIKTIQQILNKKRLDALISGDYLESPIDFVAGYYVLSFAANLHLLEEQDWIYIIVREHTGSVHAAIKDSKNRVQWSHSAERDFPLQILRMLDLPDAKK